MAPSAVALPARPHQSTPTATWRPEKSRPISFVAVSTNGNTTTYGNGIPRFTVQAHNEKALKRFLQGDAYSAAMSFVRGEFDVTGDLFTAVRYQITRNHSGLMNLLFKTLARYAPSRVETWIQRRSRAAKNIRHHYDRSNEFYRQFLDSRMVYSCAYFRTPSWTLEQAQLAKLDHICRKLDLAPGERFLDIGSGWGALVFRAAERYQARATGCTLSRRQFQFAAAEAERLSLSGRAEFQEADYRDLHGRFDKIASVGMFEHVGRHRLRNYFQKIAGLLDDGGLFLNHGIARPEHVGDGPETLFLQRRVFPGGELAHLSETVRAAEDAGFEVLDVENLRPHYAMTCRHWVKRLQQNSVRCIELVGEEIYRTWLLFLAASAVYFEQSTIDVYQLLLAKRSPAGPRRLSRDYMYT